MGLKNVIIRFKDREKGIIKKIHPDGTIKYVDIKNEKNLHCIDGPAVIWADGTVEFWFFGFPYGFKEWCKRTELSEEEAAILKMKYGEKIYLK